MFQVEIYDYNWIINSILLIKNLDLQIKMGEFFFINFNNNIYKNYFINIIKNYKNYNYGNLFIFNLKFNKFLKNFFYIFNFKKQLNKINLLNLLNLYVNLNKVNKLLIFNLIKEFNLLKYINIKLNFLKNLIKYKLLLILKLLDHVKLLLTNRFSSDTCNKELNYKIMKIIFYLCSKGHTVLSLSNYYFSIYNKNFIMFNNNKLLLKEKINNVLYNNTYLNLFLHFSYGKIPFKLKNYINNIYNKNNKYFLLIKNFCYIKNIYFNILLLNYNYQFINIFI